MEKTLIMELEKGKEYANQLQELLLLKPFGDEGLVFAKELAEKILRSFTEQLDLLNSHGRMYQIGAGDGFSFQDSGEGKMAEVKQRRRGCYKRKRASSESWVRVAATTEDVYAWRKYGQKEILNSKFPRCYFRCTHKYDQGCKATKQVQRRDDETSIMYHITYFGHHICKDTAMNPPPPPPPHQIIQESDSKEFNLIGYNKQAKKEEEEEEEEAKSDLTDNKSSSSSSTSTSSSTLWQDLIGSSESSELVIDNDLGYYPKEVVFTDYSDGLDMKTFTASFADLNNHDFTF